MFSWSDRAVDMLVRVVICAFTGGGVLSASLSSWFGRLTIRGFSDQFGVRIHHESLLDFSVWNVRLIFDALLIRPGWGSFAALISLLALIALARLGRAGSRDGSGGGYR